MSIKFPGHNEAGLRWMFEMVTKYPNIMQFYPVFCHPVVHIQHGDAAQVILKSTGQESHQIHSLHLGAVRGIGFSGSPESIRSTKVIINKLLICNMLDI